ncbi:putative amidohydrolase [Chitinispirillum alkaliphilum]|nr:putative amidohydrolase [Chitinispirillum alkaliphilum]
MRFALFQYQVRKNKIENHEKVKNAIYTAKQNDAQILITQECALSGYPPIEIDTIDDIDFEQQCKTLKEITKIAKENEICVLLGLIRKDGDQMKNSIAIISSSGNINYYDKRALWGWDSDNYSPGNGANGIFEYQGVKIGIRICFEVRFPEFFRELYKEKADVAIVSFCDLSNKPGPNRFATIKSHLQTRAIENVFTVISVNSATHFQTAPTAVINPEGVTLVEAEQNKESIIYYDYEKYVPCFGTNGLIHYSDKLVGV